MSVSVELRRNIRASAMMSLLSLIGKAMAVFKTIAIAALFGVSGSLDAFWVAFAIPNILPVFLRSAFVTSFVPFFLRRAGTTDEAALWRAANVLFTVALLLSAVASTVLYLRPHWLVDWMAPGLTPEVSESAAQLLQITVFSLLFVVGISMLTAISHCRQRFFAASLESVTTNVTVVIAIYMFPRGAGVVSLAIGTVLGFALQFAVMLYSCRAELAAYIRPSLQVRLPLFREYLAGVSPVLIGALSGIAMGIISQVYVSYLAKGSVSVLQYAAMVAMLPIEIVASSIQATFFPTIAKYSVGDRAHVVQAHVLAARLLVFVLTPICVVMMVLDEHIVRALFGYGKFTDEAVSSTAVILLCLVVGIIGRALTYFNFQVLHALGKPWAQVKIGFIQLAMNAVFGYLLLAPFGLAGVAVASSLSLWISVFISYGLMVRLIGDGVVRQAVGPMVRSIVLGGVTFAALYVALGQVDLVASTTTRWGYAALTAAFALAGGAIYLGVAMVAGMDETRFVTDRLRKLVTARK